MSEVKRTRSTANAIRKAKMTLYKAQLNLAFNEFKKDPSDLTHEALVEAINVYGEGVNGEGISSQLENVAQ